MSLKVKNNAYDIVGKFFFSKADEIGIFSFKKGNLVRVFHF